jgi:hypothetical protein
MKLFILLSLLFISGFCLTPRDPVSEAVKFRNTVPIFYTARFFATIFYETGPEIFRFHGNPGPYRWQK